MQEKLSLEQQRSQESVSLETQQKDLDLKVAEDLFQSLTNSYLQEDMDKQITRDQDRETLRQIATDIASRQSFRLTLLALAGTVGPAHPPTFRWSPNDG